MYFIFLRASICIFFTHVKQRQSEIFQFLDSKKIIYRALDITQSSDVKDEMRRKVGNNTALPPQIFNGDKYCGVSLFTSAFGIVEVGTWWDEVGWRSSSILTL
uniref:Zgc:153284 n=1 Tax=Astyanax mexicanus TaxID=7994 RepID=A0A8B9L1H0_ASTMX